MQCTVCRRRGANRDTGMCTDCEHTKAAVDKLVDQHVETFKETEKKRRARK